MSKYGLLIFVTLVNVTLSHAQEVFQWVPASQGIKEAEVISIGEAPWNRYQLYAGTSKGLYQTMDQGEHWQKVLKVRGNDSKVYSFAFSGASDQIIYAGTGNGLYRSMDQGKSWKRAFRKGKNGDRAVYWIEIPRENPRQIYIATGSGLYQSKNAGKEWKLLHSLSSQSIVRQVVSDMSKNRLWALTDQGIYLSNDNGEHWERIWVTLSNLGEEEEATTDSSEEEGAFTTQIHQLLFDREKEILYAASTSGVLSYDGDHWKREPQFGLNVDEIRYLTVHPKESGGFFIGSGKGLYYWDSPKNELEKISSGLIDSRINQVEASNSGSRLWITTNSGIYYSEILEKQLIHEQSMETLQVLTSKELLTHFNHEPTIKEVQEWAIRYAEVHPGKIEEWRELARKKAYLPDVSLSFGRDVDEQIDIDRGGTNDPDTYIIGPKEESVDFDFSVSWDLADLIWSSDQTSIDVRSRLMVQLREDILDEVNRLYFERRKLQVNQMLAQPKELRIQLGHELRLQELTAQIDALTGGRFSENIQSSG